MKKRSCTLLLFFFATFASVFAGPEEIPTGSYVLTTIGLDEGGEINPHHFETYSAHIANSDGEYTISIRYGRAGIIKLPLQVSGDRVSFFVKPSSGTVEGRDLLATGFFGKRSAGYIAGWSTYGENREAFKLEPFQSIDPKSGANKSE